MESKMFGKKKLVVSLPVGRAFVGTVVSLAEKKHEIGGGADVRVLFRLEGEAFDRGVRLQVFNKEGGGVAADPNFGTIETLNGLEGTETVVAFGYYMFAGTARMHISIPELVAEVQEKLDKAIEKQVEYHHTKAKAAPAVATTPAPAGAEAPKKLQNVGRPSDPNDLPF